MTEMELRNAFVHAICEYYGAKEGSAEHLDLLNWYNQLNPLPRGYAMKPHDAWCAATPSAIANKLGLTDIIFPECGCGKMIDLYKKAGRWVEDDFFVPQTGDLIMYDWDDDGEGDNTASPWHVGTVVRVKDNTIRVVEGNMAHKVWHRDVPVNGRYIRGFCCPDYASKCKEDIEMPKFIDVHESDWFADYVNYAVDHNLMVGTGNDKFEPDEPVTRAQLAVVATQLHKLLNKEE